MTRQRIDDCIEALCNKGCSAVWGYIEALEAGTSLPETQELNATERQTVLIELKSVMSVYQGSCSVG